MIEAPATKRREADGARVATGLVQEQAPALGASSALEAALSRVGDRWSLLLVDALTGGPMRFGQLQHAVPGIATNVLSQRLRHLEASRVVIARRYSARPPRHSYELTAPGRELAGALRLLAQWGADTGDTAGRAGGGPFPAAPPTPEHSACGTALEAKWWCPTCGETVTDGDDDTTVFV